jgi:hypothetical protein
MVRSSIVNNREIEDEEEDRSEKNYKKNKTR